MAVVGLLAIGGILAFRAKSPDGPRPIPVTIQSIAVLPLTNATADGSQDYFAAAMTDELTSRLSSISSLRVASRTSTSRFEGAKLPLQDIARQLGVDAVLEGSAGRAGQNVRINLRLVDGHFDRQIWSRSYTRSGNDILTLQSDLAGDVADQIHTTISPTQRQRVERRPTSNLAAYDAYLHSIYKGRMTREESELDEALRYAEEAIAADPQFAEAYVALARACVHKIFFYQAGSEFDERAFVALEKALALDPDLAEAYQTRGSLRFTALHRFDLPY